MENKGNKNSKKEEIVTTATSMDKLAATAKTINNEVVETVETIANDIMTSGKEVTAVATKSVKEAVKSVNMTKSADKIKKTAKKVNSQIVETATVLMEDVKTNSKKMQTNANKMAVEAIENVNITERVATIKKVAKTANEFTLETAEKLVDGVITNGEKWQNVANKAVKGGLKLAERQQDIVFSTLETVKGQLVNSATRLKKMFNN